MQDSPEFRQIVLTAARRVILSKLNYFKSENAAPLYPEIARLKDHIPDRDGQKFFLSQACRSITAYKKGTLPYKGGDNLLVVGPADEISEATNEPIESEFFIEARKRYGDFAHYKINFPKLGNVGIDWNGNNLEYMANSYDTIIFYVPNVEGAEIAKRLKNCGKRVIILSSLEPIPVMTGFDFADTILLGYSYSIFTFKAFFGALSGEFTPQGKLPLN